MSGGLGLSLGLRLGAGGVSVPAVPALPIFTASARPGGLTYKIVQDGNPASNQEYMKLATKDSTNLPAYPSTVNAVRQSAIADTVIAVWGDSITYAKNAETWVNKLVHKHWLLTGKRIDIINLAVDGQGWTYQYVTDNPTLNADIAARIAGIVAAYTTVRVIGFAGTNDMALNARTAALASADAATFASTATGAGVPAAKVTLVPMLPRGAGAGTFSEATRTTYNGNLQTTCSGAGYNFPTLPATVFAANAQLTGYFQADNTHPSDLLSTNGHLEIANAIYGTLGL